MTRRSRNGFTLIELTIAIAIVGLFTAIAAPNFSDWSRKQAVKDASRSLARAFTLARGEAIRTGNNHIVFTQTDALGNPLLDAAGNQVPILVLDDSRPGDPNQNCRIDAGEATIAILGDDTLSWGVSTAPVGVPTDAGLGDIQTGSSFTDGGGNDTTWVLFGPQGTPAAFSVACAIGPVASGAGAAYVSDGDSDYAAVLSPMGSVRIHSWDQAVGAWTN